LRDQRLRVAQQQSLQQAGTLELLHQYPAIEPVGMARDLHHRRAGRGVAAHEKRDADDALVAHARGFGRCARLHHIMQRDDGGDREIGVLQLSAGLEEDFAERKRKGFQVRLEAIEFRRGQGREKEILVRAVGQ
jgi:hypothetical protein